MIVVTRLNNTRFAVNPDLIERIQSSPDTTLSLVGGTSYIVTETMEEVIDLIADFRAAVIARARALPTIDGTAAQTLTVVPFDRDERSDVTGSRVR